MRLPVKARSSLDNLKGIWILTPVFGTIGFVILYIIATFFYPGGSQVDKNSPGFSWENNYWCNLLNDTAINGQHNPAKPIATIGMFFLCSTLSVFWIIFPVHIKSGNALKNLIQISGTLSMATAFFLLTNIDHDLIINIAGFFGVVAIISTLIGLYKKKWYRLFIIGLINIFLVVVNNYVYSHKTLIIYLPVIQKISLAAFLFWICCIDIYLCRKSVQWIHTANHPK